MYEDRIRAAAQIMAENMRNAQLPMYGSRLRLPDRKAIIALLKEIRQLMFPAYFGDSALMTLAAADYAALLARLAVSAARTGREEIILNPADREKLGEQVAAEANALLVKDGRTGALTVSKQTQPLKGGLLLSDGAVEVNCALETLVRLSRTDVTGEVSKLLFA